LPDDAVVLLPEDKKTSRTASSLSDITLVAGTSHHRTCSRAISSSPEFPTTAASGCHRMAAGATAIPTTGDGGGRRQDSPVANEPVDQSAGGHVDSMAAGLPIQSAGSARAQQCVSYRAAAGRAPPARPHRGEFGACGGL